jgi:signal transduction histidine kinase
MNARDRLVERSVATLFGLVVVTLPFQALVPALRPLFLPGLPFVALLGWAYAAVRRGKPAIGAWALVSTGGAAILTMVALTGGPESRQIANLPILAMAAVSWLGNRAAASVIAAIGLALVGAWWLAVPYDGGASDLQLLAGHVCSVVLCATFLAAVTRDLRAASERAWEGAADAEQAAEVARAADRARDRFLAAVSHELRTPLDTLLGYTELLREEEPEADRLEDLDRIRSAGAQLLRLVDDVLDMSRVEADELRVVHQRVDLRAVLDEVVHTAAATVAAQKNRLRIELTEPMPELCSDPHRLRQILLNLVSNAAKYTTGGEIAVAVSDHDDEVRIAVRDSGIGIPAEDLPRLFEPFVQLHEGPERRPGIGLGLALSQGLAWRLGGRITADSAPGHGSTFTLRLPAG